MNIKQLFSKIEQFPQMKSILNQFEFGLEESKIQEIFREKNLIPIQNLVDLYVWHNGSKSSKRVVNDEETNSYQLEACFIPQIAFFNLDDCIEMYKSQLGTRYPINVEMTKFFTLSETMFPIMNGDYYINLDENSDKFGMIYTLDFMNSFEDIFPLVYDSLENIFIVFIECIEKGIFYFDTDNTLSIDYDKDGDEYDNILKKVNPKSYK